MRSTSDAENIRQIIREAPVVMINQLMFFFRNEVKQSRIESLIKWMKDREEVEYDQESGLVKWLTAPKLQKKDVSDFIKAFWVIAYLGSENVDSIHAMHFPFRYEVILRTDDGALVYDIAVCNNSRDAFAASKEMQRLQINGVPDECIHLVIVPNDAIGKQMEPFGFDSYVVLKKWANRKLSLVVKEPIFSGWDDEPTSIRDDKE